VFDPSYGPNDLGHQGVLEVPSGALELRKDHGELIGEGGVGDEGGPREARQLGSELELVDSEEVEGGGEGRRDGRAENAELTWTYLGCAGAKITFSLRKLNTGYIKVEAPRASNLRRHLSKVERRPTALLDWTSDQAGTSLESLLLMYGVIHGVITWTINSESIFSFSAWWMESPTIRS
jgi:hypothetical protein